MAGRCGKCGGWKKYNQQLNEGLMREWVCIICGNTGTESIRDYEEEANMDEMTDSMGISLLLERKA